MTTILGPDGRPARSPQPRREGRAVQIRGGALPEGPADYLTPGWRDGYPEPGAGGLYGETGPGRAAVRQMCRTLYRTNGLFQIATDIAGAFLVGDNIRYGTFADPGLQTIVEEFWQANSFEELLSERLITEWFLNGETAVVWATGADAASADEPALIGLMDVDLGGFEVTADTTRGALPSSMVTGLSLRSLDNAVQRWGAGEFVWGAHSALHNNPRGWPVSMAAADFAVAYIAMLNMRLNVHHLQQRLLAVYKAFLDPNGVDQNNVPDGGAFRWGRKVGAFRRLPADGGVLPVIVRPGYTDVNGMKHEGVEESIEFLQPGRGAAEAASDMKLILRMLGLTIGGFPEHYMGEGGGATRTTASEMGLPSVRLSNKRQAAFRSTLTRIFRTEVQRRAGPDATFRSAKGKRKKVPVTQIEFPWYFPEIREEDLDTVIKRVELAMDKGLIDEETAQADLGYDPAVIAERRAGQQPKPQPGQTDKPGEGEQT